MHTPLCPVTGPADMWHTPLCPGTEPADMWCTPLQSASANLNLLALTINASVRSGVVNLNLLPLTIDASFRSEVVCECGEEKGQLPPQAKERLRGQTCWILWINKSWLDCNELEISNETLILVNSLNLMWTAMFFPLKPLMACYAKLWYAILW